MKKPLAGSQPAIGLSLAASSLATSSLRVSVASDLLVCSILLGVALELVQLALEPVDALLCGFVRRRTGGAGRAGAGQGGQDDEIPDGTHGVLLVVMRAPPVIRSVARGGVVPPVVG
jgi:hypothetical protein